MSTPRLNPVITGFRRLEDSSAVAVEDALDLACSGVAVTPIHDVDALRKSLDFRKRDCFQDAIGPTLHLDPATAPSASIVSLGRSWGESIDLSHRVRFREADVSVRVLDFGACFPTGSFKYFGMAQTIAVSHALGARRLVLPSQGNAAVAAAELVMSRPDLELELCVLLPLETPEPIVERIAVASACGRIAVHRIDGNINVCGRAMKEDWVPRGWVPIATGIEPLGTRIVGKSFMTWRTAWQGDGVYELPDFWFYPTGGGTGIGGFDLALRLMQEVGLVEAPKTRPVVVQSANNPSLVRALEGGVSPGDVPRTGGTILTGLDVSGGAALHRETMRVLEARDGLGVAVTDEESLAVAEDVLTECGVLLGVEGYAALAAVQRMIERGTVPSGANVVVVNTGAAENYGALATLARI